MHVATSNGAVALLDAGILVAGDSSAVETFLANRQTGHGIRDSQELVGLLESVEPGSTFWAVGGPSVLSRVTSQVGGPAANLPSVKQVVAYGHLDPEVGMTAVAEAQDEKSAAKIADVVRGFSAMLSLQAGQKAELAQIADQCHVGHGPPCTNGSPSPLRGGVGDGGVKANLRSPRHP